MNQFFTTDENRWFPIDHFFFAPIKHHTNGQVKETEVVAHLESHACITNNQGWAVDVVGGGQRFTFADIPSALRKMAEIIEQHGMRDKVIIELPYDRGFPHKLRVGQETAVISAQTAETLFFSYGIPWTNNGRIYKSGQKTDLEEARKTKAKMSKKARGLLVKAAGVVTK